MEESNMDYKDKSKQELIVEIKELHFQNTELKIFVSY